MISGAHRSWSSVGHVDAYAGDVIMVNPGEMHDGVPVGCRAREWRMLYFDAAVVSRITAEEDARQFEIVRPAVNDPGLAARFAQLFASATTPLPDHLLIEQSLLGLVMLVLKRHCLHPPPLSNSSPSVTRALERMNADPASPVSLSELANLSGVSRFQLLHGFAREVGTTPHAYLMQRRVRLAHQLLAAGQPIVEAAINAGFADQSHLTRAFVRQFGVTPGRFVAAIA
jgi:AraC-like DNA-binding protein